jgi:hypothetical protein
MIGEEKNSAVLLVRSDNMTKARPARRVIDACQKEKNWIGYFRPAFIDSSSCMGTSG